MSEEKATEETNEKTPGPESITLLSCPFCGKLNATVFDEMLQSSNDTCYFVYCLHCGAQGPRKLICYQARKHWNVRA